MQVVDAMHRAGADKRVQGIVACFGDAQQYIALAQVQELRNAVLAFRCDEVPVNCLDACHASNNINPWIHPAAKLLLQWVQASICDVTPCLQASKGRFSADSGLFRLIW